MAEYFFSTGRYLCSAFEMSLKTEWENQSVINS